MFSLNCVGQKKRFEIVADSLQSAGKGDQVLPFLLKELKKNPKSEELLRRIGYLYIDQNDPDLGKKYYREAITVNPTCARCYMNLGRAEAMQNNFSGAIELLDKAIHLDPKDSQPVSVRAKVKKAAGDKLGAMIDFNKTIELEPQNAFFYIDRGIYNAELGYLAIGLSDLNKAIELAPENYYPYFQRASIYYNKQSFDEAMADIEHAMKLDSTRHELFNGRGAIYSVKKQHERAIKDYERAIELFKDDYLPYYNIAGERYKLEDMDGHCDAIKKAYEVLLKFAPESPDRQDMEHSLQVYCDSSTASYYYQRGIALYNLRKFDESILIYSRGLKKFPTNSMMLSFRGNALLAARKYKEAINDYYLSIQNKDNLIADIKVNAPHTNINTEGDIKNYVDAFISSMKISIAEARFGLGEYETALEEVNAGIRIGPDLKDFGKESYYNLRGNIYLATEKYSQALADFEKSIQLNPKFAPAYVNKAIARINLSMQVKLKSISVGSTYQGQPFNANWTFPVNINARKSDAGAYSALLDCNRAIELEPEYAYAYYIRGQLKKMLTMGDYCYDLIKAKALDYPVEAEIMKGCGK